ncbi:MAG: twin-arginine translocase subunit TatB [Lautropia sp.]|nr:MAG: twin-arginine translocase subunit TatB [Pseudomonadota bacterium]MBC6960780.1 twin-arginine translocase subunit TatB [Lautropia sp.]MCL4703300.1 Sec-independent protein translocase protein TatB [Burkholderiaceae bacterium]MCZ2415032.1 Sec-independent protein translocase protein TatB [Burkholderiales bacterium]MDL1908754.1 twin-arginine translocase subunit TatB [Betaproteobacteria bacterium PRO1]
MFDFGFSEMIIVAIVGLIVLGPERLPKVAKQAGQWLGKLQRYVADVKSDINRQMELDELRNLQSEVSGAARDLQESLQSTIAETRSQFDSITADLEGAGGAEPLEPATDWEKVYAQRRLRERIRDRRIEREKELGHKRPKRRLH